MKKILDYEEMLDLLDSLNPDIIKKEGAIGKSEFGEDILSYSYGHGDNHVILTAGTHSSELIGNIFLLRFMKRLSDREIEVDKKFTLHFIPIVNPDGTIINTSAIRTVIPRDVSEIEEQMSCLQFYLNSVMDDNNALKGNKENKIIHKMFQYATPLCISDKYYKLRDNVERIIKENNLPRECLINWTSNGHGVDLNSNIESGVFFEKFLRGEEEYAHLRFNQIDRLKLGPMGCPSREKKFIEESENTAVLKYYKTLKEKYDVVGSIIYHSCGGLVCYLDEMEEENFWDKNYGLKEIEYNRKVGEAYVNVSGYKIKLPKTYTTFCAKLRTLLPGTLVVELGTLRSTPLSQFINIKIDDLEGLENVRTELKSFNRQFDKTCEINEKAIIKSIEVMASEYSKYVKN